MDTNRVLLFTVVVAWALGVPRVARAARLGQTGWLAVYGGLLAITLLGAYHWPDWFGIVSALLFALLVIVPSVLQRQLWQLMGAQRYVEAARVAAILRLLHPADGNLELPAMISALEAAQRGHLAQAEAGLTRIIEGSPALAPQARVHLFRMRGDWQGYLDSTRAQTSAELSLDLGQLNSRLRALGETGQIEELVTTYAAHATKLAAPANALVRVYAQLFVAAFAGRLDVLERLLSGPLSFLGEPTHLYWRATCAYAAGQPEQGEAALYELLQGAEPGVVHGARLRLAKPPLAAAPLLSAQSRAQLDDLALQADHEARFGEGARSGPARITRGLVGLNVLAFTGEVLAGGSQNAEAIYAMGALISGSLSPESSWRLLAALFLHLGPLHLGMNMLALLTLGPFVEVGLGKWRMLLVYLASGLTGSLIVASVSSDPPGLFLGASGCIMGLLGATTAILLHGHRKERARPAGQRLWRIALILVLQLAFDLSVEGISLTAHWSGIAMGLVLGYVLVPTAPHSERKA